MFRALPSLRGNFVTHLGHAAISSLGICARGGTSENFSMLVYGAHDDRGVGPAVQSALCAMLFGWPG